MAKIESNLVGSRVKITIGFDDEAIAKAIEDRQGENNPSACWRHLGDNGQVRAVSQDKDGEVICSVELDGTGQIEKFYATHLRVLGL